MASATLSKFGYPTTLVGETAHWAVLVRPEQPTLGSLALICREPVQAFGDVSPAAFAELGSVVTRIEALLREFTQYEKINYLMLMMMDPDVHFHVIPRYEGEREHAGLRVPDAGWPGPPALGKAVTPDAAQLRDLVTRLRAGWAGLPA
ncbi:HIT family protein [Roseomonas marmotae]|uniref:HIT family protein n=1 Tax=Roseomonas marmotae TaxID=2768161 RepID=A0ABS3KEG7_9PROT|nr:HIT family protein [Roseomonas marmotae]MBO1075871.1 HIT family protein [Roseomonas marmotae]QTI81941.1 HIT family protein [Roseomonas marmotae]